MIAHRPGAPRSPKAFHASHRPCPVLAAALAVAATFVAVGPLQARAQEGGTVVAADARVQGLTYTFPETGAEVPYALFVPSTYDASREWPLIVALHGLGRPFDWMMGYDGFIDMAEQGGYIVVSPLGYHPRAWYGSRGYGVPGGAAREGDRLPENLGALSEQDVMNVLGLARERFRIDTTRIYLWGHSMGGAGLYMSFERAHRRSLRTSTTHSFRARRGMQRTSRFSAASVSSLTCVFPSAPGQTCWARSPS
jgi:poly(3-hydroxybutyrate) depolymerase